MVRSLANRTFQLRAAQVQEPPGVPPRQALPEVAARALGADWVPPGGEFLLVPSARSFVKAHSATAVVGVRSCHRLVLPLGTGVRSFSCLGLIGGLALSATVSFLVNLRYCVRECVPSKLQKYVGCI